jgi:hypothetical protein
MKNLLFHLKAVKTSTHKAEVQTCSRARTENILKAEARAGAETNSLGSATLPVAEGDIATIKKVQEKALRMTSGLRGERYEQRCREAGLETLEARRKIQDITQLFKILKGIDKMDPEKLFSARRTTQNTRQSSNPLNIAKKQAMTEVRKGSFGLRVVDEWNRLPDEEKSIDRLWVFQKE